MIRHTAFFGLVSVLTACSLTRHQDVTQEVEPSRRSTARSFSAARPALLPAIHVAGSLSPATIDHFQRIAVVPFRDAPQAPTSGVTVSALVAATLGKHGFTVIDSKQLGRAMEQQPTQRVRMGDQWARDIGRIVEAEAVATGEVSYWSATRHTDGDGRVMRDSQVALAWRLLDVATGEVLFAGEGHFETPVHEPLQRAAQAIVRELVFRLAVQGGLQGSSHTGVRWVMETSGTTRQAVIGEVEPDTPGARAGVRVGDIVLSCNGLSSDQWYSQWQAMRACEVESGQTLILTVRRGSQRLTFQIPATERSYPRAR